MTSESTIDYLNQSIPDEQTAANLRAARTLNSRPFEDSLVTYHSVGHLLDQRAVASPDKIFLIHYDSEGNRAELSYAEFARKVNRVANLLLSRGVRRGDRVATIMVNHVDTVLIYFACWKIGATVAPQNTAEDDSRIAFILRNSESVICLVRGEYAERAAKIIRGTDAGLGAANIHQIVQVGGSSPYADFLNYEELLQTQSDHCELPSEPTLMDESLLVYTSGTTGAPKGVVLVQYNMLADAHAIAAWQQITPDQRLMNVLPIHHVNGIIVTLITPLYAGASVVLNRQYQSSTFWQRIAWEKVHIVSVVPTLLQFCCEYADAQEAEGNSIWGEGVSAADLAHFRHLICGAGTLAVALVKRFEDRFGKRILHGYGLSETTCYSCYLPTDLSDDQHQHWLEDFGYPSIGCPISVNEMAIFDALGEGKQLGSGERGEICVRGHNVMKYYYQRPDSNRETFKFGWFRTGDEGFYEVDEQGRHFFFITGRLKELINRGGVKFSPFDIEEVLLQIRGVKVGLAIAFENDYYGEEVGAYIVQEPEASLTEAEVLAYCRRVMSFEKSPKVVVFGSEIPVTTTGKYQRLRLRDRFLAWKSVQFKK
ncbi:MAG: acyl--CoA ligase [Anaerolineae bacterium]|nr:acyl--CoA ligase [Anaerolineae bacterium]